MKDPGNTIDTHTWYSNYVKRHPKEQLKNPRRVSYVLEKTKDADERLIRKGIPSKDIIDNPVQISSTGKVTGSLDDPN